MFLRLRQRIANWLVPSRKDRQHRVGCVDYVPHRALTSTGRTKYVPHPDTVTWVVILNVLASYGRPMTSQHITKVTNHTTVPSFLIEMVRAGVVEICGREVSTRKGPGKYLYALPEWSKREDA